MADTPNRAAIPNILLGKFIRISPLHNLKRIARKKDMAFLCSSTYGFRSPARFLELYKDFCLKHQRKLPDGQHYRYGWVTDILLPKREWNDGNLSKFVSSFAKKVIGEEKGIRYIAYKYRTGKHRNVQRVRIWFCDRECYQVPVAPTYKKNVYMNSETHRMCSRKDPKAVIICRKGEKIKNAENQIFSATKSRFLSIKMDDFQSFRIWLSGIFEDVLKLCGYQYPEKKYRFKRSDVWGVSNRFVRRTRIAQNRAKAYVETTLNKLYGQEYSKAPDKFVTFDDPFQPKLKGNIFKSIQNLYAKYFNIFQKLIFKDDQSIISLNTSNCMTNEQASYRLIELFDADAAGLYMQC